MKNKEQLIKKILADQLGIDAEDIHNDDSLYEDLHMNPSEITDFTESLIEKDLATNNIDFTEIETVEDLLEMLGVTEDFS
jgi:acyl carrier protein